MSDKKEACPLENQSENHKSKPIRSEYLKNEVDSLYSVLGLAHLSDVKLKNTNNDLKNSNNHQGENNAKY